MVVADDKVGVGNIEYVACKGFAPGHDVFLIAIDRRQHLLVWQRGYFSAAIGPVSIARQQYIVAGSRHRKPANVGADEHLATIDQRPQYISGLQLPIEGLGEFFPFGGGQFLDLRLGLKISQYITTASSGVVGCEV